MRRSKLIDWVLKVFLSMCGYNQLDVFLLSQPPALLVCSSIYRIMNKTKT